MSFRVPSNIDAIAKKLSQAAEKYDANNLLAQYFEIKSKCSNGDCKQLIPIKEKLFACYVLLLIKITLKIIEKHNIPFCYQEDVYQEAFKAFNIALEKFDPERGFQFSTYLYKVVYNQVNKFIINSLHLVRDKRYSYTKVEDDKKYEFVRLDEITHDKINYETEGLSQTPYDIFDRELFDKILSTIKRESETLYTIIIKMLNGEKLTKKEKTLFNKSKHRIRNFLKREFGISSIEEFFL